MPLKHEHLSSYIMWPQLGWVLNSNQLYRETLTPGDLVQTHVSCADQGLVIDDSSDLYVLH